MISLSTYKADILGARGALLGLEEDAGRLAVNAYDDRGVGHLDPKLIHQEVAASWSHPTSYHPAYLWLPIWTRLRDYAGRRKLIVTNAEEMRSTLASYKKMGSLERAV